MIKKFVILFKYKLYYFLLFCFFLKDIMLNDGMFPFDVTIKSLIEVKFQLFFYFF